MPDCVLLQIRNLLKSSSMQAFFRHISAVTNKHIVALLSSFHRISFQLVKIDLRLTNKFSQQAGRWLCQRPAHVRGPRGSPCQPAEQHPVVPVLQRHRRHPGQPHRLTARPPVVLGHHADRGSGLQRPARSDSRETSQPMARDVSVRELGGQRVKHQPCWEVL